METPYDTTRTAKHNMPIAKLIIVMDFRVRQWNIQIKREPV
jgi:hypothetical protein